MNRLNKNILLLIASILITSNIQAADVPQRSAQEIVTDRCQLCHGVNGEGSSLIYPRLAAQHPEYMIKQLKDFRSGSRKGTMNEMAADLTDGEIITLAEYFSTKPALTHKVRKKELAAVGAYIFKHGNKYSDVPACQSCHGENGKGTKKLPRLAGQHKRYIITQLQDFNLRQRTNDNAIMHSIASKLTELETEAVARYISGLK